MLWTPQREASLFPCRKTMQAAAFAVRIHTRSDAGAERRECPHFLKKFAARRGAKKMGVGECSHITDYIWYKLEVEGKTEKSAARTKVH